MIAFKEKYDFSFGYLEFPHSPFDLAVFEDNGQVIVRPLIDLGNRPTSPFFSYKGEIFETDDFESRDDSFPPESISVWIDNYLKGESIHVNLEMSEKEQEIFRFMLQRKKIGLELQIEKINEWLSKR